MCCTRPSFDLLVDGLTICRSDLKLGRLECDLVRDELKLCSAKVAELSAKLPCPVVQPPSAHRFIGGYALGLLGAVAVAASLVLPLPPAARAGMGLGGIVGIGVGMVLVLP